MSSRRWKLAALLAGAVAFVAAPALAYVLNGYRWPGTKPRIPFDISTNLMGNVPYSDPNWAGAGTFADAVQAIRNAANTWAVEGGSEFEFVYMGTTSLAATADDGINVVYFDAGQCPYWSARAACWYHQTSGDFRGFDIVLHKLQGGTGNQTFWSARSYPLFFESDIESKMLHEFGHALGLDHSQYASVVMDTGCGPGCSLRHLSFDEMDGVRALYGLATNAGFWASTTTPQPNSWVTLSLDYGAADAGLPYDIFVSTSGSSPGFMLGNYFCSNENDSRVLPVNQPFLPVNTPQFVNFTGTLDAQGKATAQMFIPPNSCEAYSLGVLVTSNAPNPCSGAAPPSGVTEVSVSVVLTPSFGPSVYCTAKTNSQGCVPAIGFSGAPSASSSSPFTITATNVLNQKSGLLFYGFAANAAPFQGGTMCVQSPVHRTPIQNSNGNAPPDDCSGSYSLDFNALIQSTTDPLLVLGAHVFAQFWSRDPAIASTTGLTDALDFWVCQ